MIGNFSLVDTVRMKKPHPAAAATGDYPNGADIKIKCLDADGWLCGQGIFKSAPQKISHAQCKKEDNDVNNADNALLRAMRKARQAERL
jgi:hypothetical protein